jgi:hypothetical protein
MDPKTISLSTISRREEIPFLLNNRDLRGSGVEVGVQRGVFSETLLRNWEGSKLYLVDIWRPSGDSADPANVALPLQRDNLLATFDAVTPYDPRAVIIREDSIGASRLFRDQSLDFVYIDAGHTYLDASTDIQAWAPRVRKGGLLMGHDYMDGEVRVMAKMGGAYSSFYVEVRRAVNEWAACCGKTVCTTKESQFRSWLIEM